MNLYFLCCAVLYYAELMSHNVDMSSFQALHNYVPDAAHMIKRVMGEPLYTEFLVSSTCPEMYRSPVDVMLMLMLTL